jgi:hypothetical protein
MIELGIKSKQEKRGITVVDELASEAKHIFEISD